MGYAWRVLLKAWGWRGMGLAMEWEGLDAD